MQIALMHDIEKLRTLRLSLRARNPRFEPGMGMIPDPPQIGDWGRGWTPDPRPFRDGDGDGDGPPIPGKSGIGDHGDDPRL
jgi:hypothetical protein